MVFGGKQQNKLYKAIEKLKKSYKKIENRYRVIKTSLNTTSEDKWYGLV
jgi:archaellum component FlaC